MITGQPVIGLQLDLVASDVRTRTTQSYQQTQGALRTT